MKRILKGVLITLGVLAGLAVAAGIILYIQYGRNLYVPDAGDVPEYMISGGTLFDGTGTDPYPNPGILLRDGAIACVGPSCTGGSEAIHVDATGLAIVPGLIDLHVHFLAITADNADLSVPAMIWNIARARPDVRRKLLEAGVTSLRDVGGPQDVMIDLKHMIESGEIAGPRLFVAGPIFTAPGGHPAYGGDDPNRSGFGGNMAFQSNDAGAIRDEIGRLANLGVDGIKAVFHGTVSDSGDVLLPTLSPETLAVLIDAARSQGLWVAVHVGPETEAGTAARLGATTIEHGVRAGNLVDQETLRQLVEHDVVYVPTLGREPLGHLNIPALYDAGVIIGVGTDTNNPEMSYGDSYHEELERLVEAGMPPEAVLLAATRNAAMGLGRSADLGTIEAGNHADLLLVAGEPWLDVTDLRRIKTVIQKGRVVSEVSYP